jgi:hypothetical protein
MAVWISQPSQWHQMSRVTGETIPGHGSDTDLYPRSILERQERKMTKQIELHFLGSGDALVAGGGFKLVCMYPS